MNSFLSILICRVPPVCDETFTLPLKTLAEGSAVNWSRINGFCANVLFANSAINEKQRRKELRFFMIVFIRIVSILS
jgi:hypothetical protein